MGEAQFEKAEKGLECCIPSIQECQCVDGCPYYDSCWSVDDEYDPMYLELMRDALALIRQQQARIAELEAELGQRDYNAAVEMQQYCERYEPTYNPEDGSM